MDELNNYGIDDSLYPLRENPLKSVPEWVSAFIQNIPFGKENAVTREQLSSITMMRDRKVRKFVEIARNYGYVIINDGDGRGYYQSNDIADIEAQYRRETSRAMAILTTRKYLRQRMKEAGRAV